MNETKATAKFTPGPWREIRGELVGSDGSPVRFYGEGIVIVMTNPSERDRANYDLLISCTDLYAALDGLTFCFPPPRTKRQALALEAARAALQKAVLHEGKQEQQEEQ